MNISFINIIAISNIIITMFIILVAIVMIIIIIQLPDSEQQPCRYTGLCSNHQLWSIFCFGVCSNAMVFRPGYCRDLILSCWSWTDAINRVNNVIIYKNLRIKWCHKFVSRIVYVKISFRQVEPPFKWTIPGKEDGHELSDCPGYTPVN